jgi:hypothetical protein
MSDGIHNPISGISSPKAGFVMTDAILRNVFKNSLHQNMARIIEIQREACWLPHDIWPEEAMHIDTSQAIDAALDCGMATFEDVIGFLTLRHAVSYRFYEFPVVNKYLRAQPPLAGHKIQNMMLALPLAVWSIARRRMANSWYPPAKPEPQQTHDFEGDDIEETADV